MNKAKSALKTAGLMLALPAAMTAACLLAVRPVDAACGETSFTAVSVLGRVWMPWEQVPSGKVVTVEDEAHVIRVEEPVDEEAVRHDEAEATQMRMEAKYEAQIETLEAQIDEVNLRLEEAQAALDRREADEAAAAKQAEQQKQAAVSAGNQAEQQAAAAQTPQSAATSAAAPGAEAGSQSPPAAQPSPSVDAAALIANAHAYALGKNMGVNAGLSIGNAGYFNPVDISVLAQDAAQSDLYYCIDQIARMMGSVEQDHPPVYNIVQDGSKIYVLYG